MFQGLITDKPSSETWEYRNCYNNSSVQTMQCCLTSKNYKTYMYLSTDPCSLASMSYQLFLKQLIWIGTISYVYFICFQTGNFFLQSQNSTSAIYVTEQEKFEYYWITRKRSVYVTELEKFENYWITERQSVTLLSQDNAKQINQVYCMWFKNIHAVFVKLLNWLGVHKLQGPVQYLLMSTFMYGKNNTKQYMSTLITWDKQT